MSSDLSLGDVITLEVERLARGGSGVTRDPSGRVVFIPNTVPGDRVSAKIIKIKKKFAEAKLLEVLQQSSNRVPPKCSYFLECGGCTWQNVDYQTQTSEKRNQLQHQFKRLYSGTNEISVHPSPQLYNYRNRIQVEKVGAKIHKKKRGSHELVPIERCEVADERINDLIRNTRWGDLKDGRYELSTSSTGETHSRSMDEDPHFDRFSQVNNAVNDIIRDKILSLSSNSKTCLELYSGNGNFTDLLNEKFEKVTSVEINPSLTAIAKERAPDPDGVICADVDDFLKTLSPMSSLCVFLDPPRTGLSPIARKNLKRLNPREIWYLSCDPATQKRDCEEFSQNGYQIEALEGFDMFPHTDHTESLALLRDKK